MKALAGIKTQPNPNIIANIPQDIDLRLSTATVDIVGSPTINLNTISGFSSSNYLTTKSAPSNVISYEWVCKFKTGSNITTQQGILANLATNIDTPQIYISNGGYIGFLHPINSSTWSSTLGYTPLTANTTYWIKAVWDGSNIYLYGKTSEGDEYTLAGTASASTISWTAKVGIGIDTTSYPFLGTLYLDECYININGSRWWTGEIGNILTLKAGSKVYVPDGFEQDGTTLKFEEVIIEQDILRRSVSTADATRYIWLDNGVSIMDGTLNYTFSGNTSTMNSTTANTYSTFYNITTNKIYRGDGSNWQEKPYSLPIAICSNSSSLWRSIDQVFSGFGYIGSTVFSLPGIRTLTPDGKNSDGTYKVLDITTEYVITRTWTNSTTISYKLFHSGISFGVLGPSVYSYDSTTNYNYNNGEIFESCLIGDISFTSGKITSLTINPVQNPYLSSPIYSFFLRGSKYKAFNYEGNINHDIIYYESLGPYNKTFTLPAGDYFIAITGGGGAGISWAYSGYPWSASGGSGATWEGIFHNPVEQSATIVAGAKQANSYMELGGIRMITAGKGANAAINVPGAGGTLTVNSNLQVVSVKKSTNGKNGGMNTSTTASTSSYGWGKANNGAGGILLKEI